MKTDNRKFWDYFFGSRGKHYYSNTLKKYKKRAYEKVFDEDTKDIPKDKNILLTDSYDLFFNLDLVEKFREKNSIISLDISRKCVEGASKNYNGLINGDSRKIPLKENSIDMIVSPSTLDHFKKDDFKKALREIERILKVNGKAFIFLHNQKNIFLRFQILNLIEENDYFTYNETEIKQIMAEQKNLHVKDISFVFNLPFPFLSTSFINFLDEHEIHSSLFEKILNNAVKINDCPCFAELIYVEIKKVN